MVFSGPGDPGAIGGVTPQGRATPGAIGPLGSPLSLWAMESTVTNGFGPPLGASARRRGLLDRLAAEAFRQRQGWVNSPPKGRAHRQAVGCIYSSTTTGRGVVAGKLTAG
jgi:hypothetical protein